jgi:hypothetical protein
MEQALLSDPTQFPSEEIIFSHLGKSRTLWLSLFDYIQTNHPDIMKEWRYYRDGKSWLLKVTQKKKTIFWLSIQKGAFRTTFYFTDKAKEAILSSDLSNELKEQFQSGKNNGKIKGLTINHTTRKNIDDAKILIGIKLRMK